MNSKRTQWQVKPSDASRLAHNPIRSIVDKLKIDPSATKQFISLAVELIPRQCMLRFIGDPTTFGNFNVDPVCNDIVIEQLRSSKNNGYICAHGSDASREAVAKLTSLPEAPITKDNVILTSGCTTALQMCFTALSNKGQNILIPRPSFSLYTSLAKTHQVEARFYNLLPERNWEVDIEHLESLVDENTAFLIVNNPSNPCGSVYTHQHLEAILKVAQRQFLPVVADEIYWDLVFEGNKFYPLASINKEVPIISASGLSKKWMVPGWRMGWLTIHDQMGRLPGIYEAFVNLSQIALPCNSLIDSSVPGILKKTPASFHKNNIEQLQCNARASMEAASKVESLKPIMPQGSMFIMIGVDIHKFKDIVSDVDFSQKLLAEESVLCLPGQCFGMPNFIRCTTTPPLDCIEEAYKRIDAFCKRHYL
ncbi:tyrosine aminotransferase [Spinellus fusiger]|nr:tyrosine aminotransferase [Spinellus fusiger]